METNGQAEKNKTKYKERFTIPSRFQHYLLLLFKKVTIQCKVPRKSIKGHISLAPKDLNSFIVNFFRQFEVQALKARSHFERNKVRGSAARLFTLWGCAQ